MKVSGMRADTKRDALRRRRLRSAHRTVRFVVVIRRRRRRARRRYALACGGAVAPPRQAVSPIRGRAPRRRRCRRHRARESRRAAPPLGRVRAVARCARHARASPRLHALHRHELLGASRRARGRARGNIRPRDDRGACRCVQARSAAVPRRARRAHVASQTRALRRGVGARRRWRVALGHGCLLGEPGARAATGRREGAARGRGPPRPHRTAGGLGIPIGRDAIVLRDDGLPCDPQTDLDWLDWVAAGETRNWCKNDLLLDWLDEYPTVHHFARDDELPGYDETFDLGRFLMHQGRAFEKAVLADLAQRWELVRITHRPDEARQLSAALATQEALEAGVPIIAAGVLRDPQLRTFGVVDLLVRSDVLGQLCPAAFVGDPLELAAIGLSHGRHYRVVDVKFKTLELLKTTGGLSTSPSDLDTLAQAWVYNEALGRIQGYTPPASYVVGRAWKQGEERGDRSWERIARVPHDTVVRGRGSDLRDVVQEAAAWIRRVRTEGAEWRALPVPSVPELWPNMKADSGGRWHDAKARIASALAEITLLPRVNTAHRARAHEAGVTRWDDPRMSAD